MYDGTLVSRGPWQAVVTFQQLIVLANRDGIVDMTPEAISRRTSIPLDIITLGIEELMKPDPRSRTPDDEGRRITLLEAHRDWGWHIVNHEKYRQMRNAEERREYLRVKKTESRARRKEADDKSKAVNISQQVSRKVNRSTDAVCSMQYADTKEKEKQRATRLPKDFPLEADIDWCKKKRPYLDPREVKDQFRDYWTANPKGAKLDWPATWRTWVRNTKSSLASKSGDIWGETK